MKRISALILLMFIAFNNISQTRQKVGDKFYDELAYIKAVEYYEDLASSKKATTYQIRRTADCYYKLANYPQAELWLAKLVSTNEATELDYIAYFNTLKINQKYIEANELAQTIKTKFPNNNYVNNYIKDPNYFQTLKIDSLRYTILTLNHINSKQSDFGATYYVEEGDTSLIFSSSRINNTGVGRNFQWDGSDFLDLYKADFNEEKELKNVGKFSKEVKSKYHEGPVSFSNNYTVMYLTRSNYLNKEKEFDDNKHNNLKLYISKKDAKGNWGELVEFPYNSTAYSLGHAAVTEDGKTMYFISDMPGGKGETDVWVSNKENETWSKPKNVEEINTPEKEMFPSLNPNGEVLYFASEGHVGLGGLDLYRFKLVGNEAGKLINMGYPLNTSRDDFGLITNTEETIGYFTSNSFNSNESGNDDIYKVLINEPFEPKLIAIKGTVVDDKTNELLLNSNVNVYSSDEKLVAEQNSMNGQFEFKDLPEDNYTLKANNDCYELVEKVDVEGVDYKQSPFTTKLEMNKIPCILIGVVKDIEKENLLTDVTITIVNNITSKTYTYSTNSNGAFSDSLVSINCPTGKINYSITINKEGYLTKKIAFVHTIKYCGAIKLHELINIDLQEDKSDVLVNDFCEIGDIFYDFDKSNIRPDAALELDQLIACMNNNPYIKIEIGSHTDCRGSAWYNLILADKRAKSAMQYVISKGIDKNRIFGKGYGEDKLKNDCGCEGTKITRECSEEEHQQNRRTEFKIVKK